MATVNPELSADDERLAQVVESFLNRFSRTFDLAKVEHRATLAEACHEIGHHIAGGSTTATLQLQHGPKGVTGFTVTCNPS